MPVCPPVDALPVEFDVALDCDLVRCSDHYEAASATLGMPSGELWMPLEWAHSSWPGARPVDTCALAVSVHWTDHQLPAPGELFVSVFLAQPML